MILIKIKGLLSFNINSIDFLGVNKKIVEAAKVISCLLPKLDFSLLLLATSNWLPSTAKWKYYFVTLIVKQ